MKKILVLAGTLFAALAAIAAPEDPGDTWKRYVNQLPAEERNALYEGHYRPDGTYVSPRMDWVRSFESYRPPVMTDEELWRQTEIECVACGLHDPAQKQRYFELLKSQQEEAQARSDEHIARVLEDETGEWRIQFRRDARERVERARVEVRLDELERRMLGDGREVGE